MCPHAGIPVVATQRDPTMYSYGVKPSTDAGAYVTIHSGGAVVSFAGHLRGCAGRWGQRAVVRAPGHVTIHSGGAVVR